MIIHFNEPGNLYHIFVNHETLSVYVRWQMNDVIRTDDEELYTFYKFPRKGLVGVGTPGTGPINPTSTEGSTIMSAPSDSTTDTTPATS